MGPKLIKIELSRGLFKLYISGFLRSNFIYLEELREYP